MCSKTTPGSFQDNRTHPMKTRRKTKSFSSTSSTSSSSSSKLARKTRTKTRKHKFISLRRDLDLSPSPAVSSPDSSATENHQLNLFPLHPENLYEEKEDNVTHFFETDGGGATTLNEFLWGGGGGGCAVSSEEDTLALSPATTLTYTYGGQDREECCGSLEKTALRHRDERDPSEEKWVCYSEVVEKKKVEVEVPEYCWKQNKTKRLSLKLDYQEIMNAWADKGPLYIEGEGPQVVPDILDDAMAAHDNTNMMRDVGNVWKVPDDGSSVGVMEGGDPGEGWKVGNREARVLRYKEKRQSRLFSKRIRYEVRKLNAEKRPRMKGRFVKRS